MGRLQSEEEVNVIGNAANSVRKSAQAGDRAAQILAQASAPSLVDQRKAILCGENQVVVEAEVGR